MIVETAFSFCDDYMDRPTVRAHAERESRYQHYQELQKHITFGKNGPVLRVQTLDDEWHVTQGRYRPDIGKAMNYPSLYSSPFDRYNHLILRTWVSYAYPMSCPVGGTVLDADMRMVFPDAKFPDPFMLTYPKPMAFGPDVYCYHHEDEETHRQRTVTINFWRRMQ